MQLNKKLQAKLHLSCSRVAIELQAELQAELQF
jgi:hypothetical protein